MFWGESGIALASFVYATSATSHAKRGILDLKVRIAQFLLLTNSEKQQTLVVLLCPVLPYFSYD